MVPCEFVAGANTCRISSPLVFCAAGPKVEMSDLTPSLAFFGLRNTSHGPGIFASKTQRASGGWWFAVGRLRLCQQGETEGCL